MSEVKLAHFGSDEELQAYIATMCQISEKLGHLTGLNEADRAVCGLAEKAPVGEATILLQGHYAISDMWKARQAQP